MPSSRLRAPGAIGLAGLARQQGARLPVSPGAVLARGLAHGLDGAAHGAPLPGAQGARTFQPSRSSFKSWSLPTLLKYPSAEGDRRSAACLPITPQTQWRSSALECYAPFVLQQLGGGIGVTGGLADQGQRHQLLALARAWALRAGAQVFGGLEDAARPPGAAPPGATMATASRTARGRLASWRSGAPRATCPAPTTGARQTDSPGSVGAAVVGIALAVPAAQHLIAPRPLGRCCCTWSIASA